ncbi:MAG: CamS family sex pheromone protein [Bacilli bacterium]|jgi:protein involved in sex pheromone biosynthesis
MKRNICLLFLLLLLTGCYSKNTISEVEDNYNRSFYKVYEPYKSQAKNNYATNRLFNRYDLREVEMGLMRISTNYFVPTKYYYQAGQYLTKDVLDTLLSSSKLNKVDTELDYQPRYISYLHEQNYLNINGELKGISIALILNPYQSYTDVNNKVKQVIVSEDELITFGQVKARELLAYIRDELKLKDIEIVIGLYIQQSTNSMIPGSYVYETFTREQTITKFNKLDEQYYLLASSDLKTVDINTYDAVNQFKNKIQSLDNVISTIGRGLYINKQLQELSIDVSVNYMSIGEVNSLAQIIAQEILTLFNDHIIIEVTIRTDNKIEAIISKDDNQDKCKIFFIN